MRYSILYIILSSIVFITSQACNRIPPGTTAAKSPVDDNFMISISGNPETYIPGQKYNVTLSALNGMTFQSFIIGLESDRGDMGGIENLGNFEISDYTETRFSQRCANVVENTNTNAKTRVEITWVAPTTTGNGCILLRATVIQHRDVWYMDDGFLTKKICEEEIDDIDTQTSILVDPCCACDEAKYELTFEGKWSRHTHPKDFPANSWRTRFSDIIGASHTIDYRFWKYGELASDGLREVAEHGSTRTLESELKDQSEQIRTIIKARGIAYPNVTGKTFAVFRVDSKHHLISLVSMIDPSPDWIVGVSGLELCLPNCSWVENKVHNLYPWDAGSDSGPSYMSADQPQVPPDVIRRIKSNFPNDPRSPFYDPTGAPMKPLATLHINRRRLYEKTCENTDSSNDPPECETLPWSSWDQCSAKCGPGKQYRTREFKNQGQARRAKCRNALREEQNCNGRKCNGFNEEEPTVGQQENTFISSGPENPECAISDWSEWSGCTVSCGAGEMIRSRHYLNPRAKKKCQKASRVKLQETQKCEGVDCGGDIANGDDNAAENTINEDADNADMAMGGMESLYRYRQFESFSQKREDYIPPECGFGPWSDFSPCIGKCDEQGQRQRERKIWNYNKVYGITPPNQSNIDLCEQVKRFEFVNCTLPACDATVPTFCYEEPQPSHCRGSDVNNFWFYDHLSDQCAIYSSDKCDVNRNKFNSKEECEEKCQRPRHRLEAEDVRNNDRKPIDCKVSEWWLAHACNVTCGDGFLVKMRKVLRPPKYGGKVCPKHLVRLEACYQHCDDIYSIGGGGGNSHFPNIGGERRHVHSSHARQNIEQSECQYSNWSAWTPCTATCGGNAVRQKTRTLINTESNYKCRDRVRIEKCLVMPCLLSSNDEE